MDVQRSPRRRLASSGHFATVHPATAVGAPYRGYAPGPSQRRATVIWKDGALPWILSTRPGERGVVGPATRSPLAVAVERGRSVRLSPLSSAVDRTPSRWHRARRDFAQQPIQIGSVKPTTAPAL